MARLGPEFIGKLPPGALDDLNRELDEAREAIAMGIAKGVQILSGPGCRVAEAQEGVIYLIDQVPSLPLPGCQRSPCCGCCYQTVI